MANDAGTKKLQAQDRKVARAEQAHKRAVSRVESLTTRRARYAEQVERTEAELANAREAATLAQSSVTLEQQHRDSLREYVERKAAGESGLAEGFVEPEPGHEPTAG